MIRIEKPEDCCGCTACASICPHDAISMKPDALGFLYPEVDVSKCVNCGLCDKVCAFTSQYDLSLNLPNPDAYGVRHKDMSEIMRSRSGAMFVAISDYVLEHGGVVYGAGYEGHFRVVHKRATTKSERDEFRGSKYVQSDLKGVFRQIKEDLKNGITVLFSGTPCQTSGLKSYIGKKLCENLVLVDIVCHGVPSPYIWRDYLTFLENKQKDVICEVNFRDKERFGWRAHHETFKFSQGRVKIFSYTFYKHIMFRHSCANCHFCNTHRPSDITLADFWNFENVAPSFNADNKGANLVLVNSLKGREIFKSVIGQLNVIHVDLNKCLQPNLHHPTRPHPKRRLFELLYSKYGFEYTMRRFGIVGWRHRLEVIKKKIVRAIWRVKKFL